MEDYKMSNTLLTTTQDKLLMFRMKDMPLHMLQYTNQRQFTTRLQNQYIIQLQNQFTIQHQHKPTTQLQKQYIIQPLRQSITQPQSTNQLQHTMLQPRFTMDKSETLRRVVIL